MPSLAAPPPAVAVGVENTAERMRLNMFDLALTVLASLAANGAGEMPESGLARTGDIWSKASPAGES